MVLQGEKNSLIVRVDAEIDFVLVMKNYKKYVRDVAVVPRELQHKLVIVYMNKKVLREIEKTCDG